jgi:uncharacterized membrane protein YhaH (DUF805 family)
MDWTTLLFSFSGRINRGKYWLAVLIYMVAWTVFIAGSLSWLGGKSIDNLLSFAGAALLIWLIGLILLILGTWSGLAVGVKRLHDRNKSGWWIVLFFVLPCLYSQFGARLEDLLGDSYFAMLPSLNAFVFSVWGFVEMYCRKGTTGTNRFGADPLAPIDTRPPWDQQSEIEMVPHNAGPPPVWRVKPGYE